MSPREVDQGRDQHLQASTPILTCGNACPGLTRLRRRIPTATELSRPTDGPSQCGDGTSERPTGSPKPAAAEPRTTYPQNAAKRAEPICARLSTSPPRQVGRCALPTNAIICRKSDVALGATGDDCAVPDDLSAITPEAARWEADTVQDADLPMLAALWLADGYDSAQLRDLAGLTKRDGAEARALLPEVLVSLGCPIPDIIDPYDRQPWRGYWGRIRWAQRGMDGLMSPYAAAQVILEVAGDVEGLWQAARGQELMDLLREWDQKPDDRDAVDQQIRDYVRGLQESDVPALIPATGGDPHRLDDEVGS